MPKLTATQRIEKVIADFDMATIIDAIGEIEGGQTAIVDFVKANNLVKAQTSNRKAGEKVLFSYGVTAKANDDVLEAFQLIGAIANLLDIRKTVAAKLVLDIATSDINLMESLADMDVDSAMDKAEIGKYVNITLSLDDNEKAKLDDAVAQERKAIIDSHTGNRARRRAQSLASKYTHTNLLIDMSVKVLDAIESNETS